MARRCSFVAGDRRRRRGIVGWWCRWPARRRASSGGQRRVGGGSTPPERPTPRAPAHPGVPDQLGHRRPAHVRPRSCEAGPGTPAASQLGLDIAVYPCLGSVSGFDQTVSSKSGPTGRPRSPRPPRWPWPSLAPAVGGGVDVPIPVVDRRHVAGSAPAATLGDFVASLQRLQRGQRSACTRCGSNWWTPGPATRPRRPHHPPGVLRRSRRHPEAALRLGAAHPDPGPMPRADHAPELGAGRRPPRARSPAALGRRRSTSLAAVVDAVTARSDGAGDPRAPSPQTAPAPWQHFGPPVHRQPALTTAANLASERQFLWTSYVPVDAAGPGRRRADRRADPAAPGRVVAAASHSSSSSARSGTGRAGLPGPGSPTTASTTPRSAQLQAEGYDQVVLPSADVTSSPSPSSGGSTAEPFTLARAQRRTLHRRWPPTPTCPPGSPAIRATRCSPPTSWWPSWPRSTSRAQHPDRTGRGGRAPQQLGGRPDLRQDRCSPGWPRTRWSRRSPSSGLFQSLPGPVACRSQGCKLSPSPRAAGAGLPVTAIRTQRTPGQRLRVRRPVGPAASRVQIGDLVLAGRVRDPPTRPAGRGASQRPGRPSTPSWPS